MTGRRLLLPSLLAALMIGAAALIATSETRYRVDLSSLLELWGDVFRDTDEVGLTVTRVSDGREMQMGAELAKALEPFVVHDPKLQKYLDEVGTRLAAQRERKGITYRFRVVSGGGINAFALPGGNIFVTRQMLDFADSEAEIAAIVGHEISHVDLRHCIERFQYELLARRVFPSDLAALSRLPYELLRVSYSKEQEREADMGGVMLAAKAGYHPKYGLPFYERMASLANESSTTGRPGSPTIEAGKALGEAIIDYFRTHPPFADRIAVITGVLQRNESNWKVRKFYVGRSNHLQRVSWTTQPLDDELRPYGQPPALAEYLLLKKDFKALAVHSASGLSGVAVDQPTASAAIERALGECEKKIKPCRPYAVGNMVVDGMQPDEIDSIVSKYSVSGRIDRAFRSYLAAQDFKALFVDLSTGEWGAGVGASTPAAAIEEASARCSEQSARCTLYAVGDVVVTQRSKEEVDAAIEQYPQRIVAERYRSDPKYRDFKALAIDYSSGRYAVAQAQPTPSKAMAEAIRACATPTSACDIDAIGSVSVRGASNEERDAVARKYAQDVVMRMPGFDAYRSEKDFKAFVVDVPGIYWAYERGHWHPLAALNSALMRCQKSGRSCQAAAVGDTFVFEASSNELAAQMDEYRAQVIWPSDRRNPLEEYLSEARFNDFKAMAAAPSTGTYWRQWNHDAPYRAIELAVARCREKNPACQLYAIGAHVVYGKSEDEKKEVLALYTREVLEKRLEFFRQAAYPDFKAVAGNPLTMRYVFVDGLSSPTEAIEQAIHRCTEQYAPCQLFALGSSVVFGLPEERIQEIAEQYARHINASGSLSQ